MWSSPDISMLFSVCSVCVHRLPGISGIHLVFSLVFHQTPQRIALRREFEALGLSKLLDQIPVESTGKFLDLAAQV